MTQELFKRMPLGYLVLDPDGAVAYANPVALALGGGMPLEAARGRTLRDLFPSLVDAHFEEVVARTAAGETVEYEQWFSPTSRWLHVVACPTPLGRGVFIRDITDARSAHEHAQQVGRLIRGSLDAMIDPFAILRPTRGKDGHVDGLTIEYLNRAASEFGGFSTDVAEGKPAFDLFPGLRSNGVADALVRVADSGQPLVLTAMSAADSLPSGRSFAGVFDIQAVTFDERLLVIWRDVSERERMAKAEKLTSDVRALLVETLTTIPVGASLREASTLIAERLVTLSAVDRVSVMAVVGASSVEIVGAASRQSAAASLTLGTHLGPERARYLQKRAQTGAWAERLAQAEQPRGPRRRGGKALLAEAYGPILSNGEVVGLLCIATGDEGFAGVLEDSMSEVVALTAGSSAILAGRLEHYRRRIQLGQQLDHVLETHAFHAVYQPIVALEGGDIVGFEALTRFSGDLKPEQVFREAWAIDRGPDLELATLAAAMEGGGALPAGRWLSINVSPDLFTRFHSQLAETLRGATRPLIIEITENAPVVDYAAFRAARQGLGRDVRLAVDDAGAGVANFGHIVELQPDLVKLDKSLVRGVHRSLERQALVRAMALFARTAGCRLVAEGIETRQEALALTELGVEFGQGYLFGRPEPVEQVATSSRRGHRLTPRGFRN
jgi:EAL domain-containing protein (putative c-di-GMP-specific phosphodiesterase class I)/PAS domain-containing protein